MLDAENDENDQDFGSKNMRNSNLPPSECISNKNGSEIDLGGFNMDDIIKANNRNLGRYDNVNNDDLFLDLVIEEDDGFDFESEEMQAL